MADYPERKRYEILDANDMISFHTHKELLDECFGKHENLRDAN